jgi:predicted enzyme related to lactoylglutathione lyase
VTFYTETPDVTASLAKAETLGGRVVAPRTEVPGAIIGIFQDPEGHILGLVEAKAAAQ